LFQGLKRGKPLFLINTFTVYQQPQDTVQTLKSVLALVHHQDVTIAPESYGCVMESVWTCGWWYDTNL